MTASALACLCTAVTLALAAAAAPGDGDCKADIASLQSDASSMIKQSAMAAWHCVHLNKTHCSDDVGAVFDALDAMTTDAGLIARDCGGESPKCQQFVDAVAAAVGECKGAATKMAEHCPLAPAKCAMETLELAVDAKSLADSIKVAAQECQKPSAEPDIAVQTARAGGLERLRSLGLGNRIGEALERMQSVYV